MRLCQPAFPLRVGELPESASEADTSPVEDSKTPVAGDQSTTIIEICIPMNNGGQNTK
jgi:hypothetical protein